MFRPIIHLYKYTFKYLGKNRLKYFFAEIGLLIRELLFLLIPIVIGMAINMLQTDLEKFKEIWYWYFIGANALYYLSWVAQFPSITTQSKLALKISNNFKNAIFDKLNRLPLKWHKERHSGDTSSRVEKATDALFSFSESTFMYLDTFIGLVFAFGTIIYFDWQLSLILLSAICLSFLIINYYDKKIIPLKLKVNEKKHSASSVFIDYISNISTVLTLHLTKRAKEHVEKKLNKIYDTYNKQVITSEKKWLMFSNFLTTIIYIVFFGYIWRNINNQLLIGNVFILYQYLRTLEFRLYDVGWQMNQLMHYSIDLKSIDIIENAKIHGEQECLVLAKSSMKSMEIKNLCFKYTKKDKKYNLNGINFKMRQGQKIALIGGSGSGKSTFLKILKSLEIPHSAELYINDQKIHHFAGLCEKTTLIPQEPEIFENTVEYNITFGIKYPKELIEKVIKMSRFDEVIPLLPKGLKSNLAEKGVNLSGGQKQRLAVARGLLAAYNSEVLLLDEPTSSLDSTNEMKVYKSIINEFSDKTVISVLHKLNLLSLFDYIYMFENGKVVFHGTYAEIQKEKCFRELLKNYKDLKNSSLEG
ncbi:hypothetical protein CL656_07015 [bacterium]|nr:hypothetical protein [bacterium]|tara:strand:+ start:4883 stop:6640 length:1758 start_codon:yes stop_codon:yes gene_type:complete